MEPEAFCTQTIWVLLHNIHASKIQWKMPWMVKYSTIMLTVRVPIQIGVTLDRTLCYKQHIPKVKVTTCIKAPIDTAYEWWSYLEEGTAYRSLQSRCSPQLPTKPRPIQVYSLRIHVYLDPSLSFNKHRHYVSERVVVVVCHDQVRC